MFSVVLFSIPVLVLTVKGSNETFCLMNRKESICSNYQKDLDCFKNKSKFSGFIKIGPGLLIGI